MRNQLRTQHALCVGANFFARARQLYAARFAAAPGVHLRLDDPKVAAHFLGRVNRCIRAFGRNAAWHGDTVFGEKPF